MGTTALISEDAYLRTSYDPDCEYADGALIERNVGEQDHCWLQAALAAHFFRRRREWNIEVFTEQRHKIRTGRYMAPDVCVIWSPRPAERVFDKPPLIWIEILSPADRTIRVNEKVRELQEFGVPNIWAIDPETLEAGAHTQTATGKTNDGILRVPGTSIEVPLHGLEND